MIYYPIIFKDGDILTIKKKCTIVTVHYKRGDLLIFTPTRLQIHGDRYKCFTSAGRNSQGKGNSVELWWWLDSRGLFLYCKKIGNLKEDISYLLEDL